MTAWGRRLGRVAGPASRGEPAPVVLLGATGVSASVLLGLSFSATAGSRHFYLLSSGLAGTLTAGALGAGPVRWYGGDWRARPVAAARDAVVVPALAGAATFAGFYAAARVVCRQPALSRAIASVFRYADRGSTPLIVLIAASGAVAEELFYRGALWRGAHPLGSSTLAYVAVTTAAGNPVLDLAGLVTSVIFGWQRGVTGGVLAPSVAHVTWSVLMLRYVPPLFRHAA